MTPGRQGLRLATASHLARRIVESAALLVDEVPPPRPIRQWALTVPFPLRFLFADYPELMSSGSSRQMRITQLAIMKLDKLTFRRYLLFFLSYNPSDRRDTFPQT